MKTKLIAIAFINILCLSQGMSQAHAVFIPGWERPIQRADMLVAHSKFGINNVRKVAITLTHQDGITGTAPTGMIVELENIQTGKVTTETLSINQVKIDTCGITEYDAGMTNQPQADGENCGNSGELRVHLVDHSRKTCETSPSDVVTPVWQAQIGTMDSTLSASGNPEEVITIQDSPVQ